MTSRQPPRRTKAMLAAGEYWVECCADCHHPGGLHIAWPPEKAGCRGCPDCREYQPGEYGRWSDELTREMTGLEITT